MMFVTVCWGECSIFYVICTICRQRGIMRSVDLSCNSIL